MVETFHIEKPSALLSFSNVINGKVKVSPYTPWRRLWGEEV
jgi:hypothetical protein